MIECASLCRGEDSCFTAVYQRDGTCLLLEEGADEMRLREPTPNTFAISVRLPPESETVFIV